MAALQAEPELRKSPRACAEVNCSAESVPSITLPSCTRVAVEMRPRDDDLRSNKKLAAPEWFKDFALKSRVIAEVIRGEKACFVSIPWDCDR